MLEGSWGVTGEGSQTGVIWMSVRTRKKRKEGDIYLSIGIFLVQGYYMSWERKKEENKTLTFALGSRDENCMFSPTSTSENMAGTT